MKRTDVDGISLEYEIAGSGDPVLFIHGSLVADSFDALLNEPALDGQVQAITYRRRGYFGSTRPASILPVEDHATDAIGLLRSLGIEQAHLVGHSYGGAVAIQVALQAPDLVRTVSLLEPAIVVGPSRAAYLDLMEQAKRRVEAGEPEATVQDFFAMRFGKDFRSWLDASAPNAFTSAVEHAHSVFSFETIGLAHWQFDSEAAAAIQQPVLLVLGSDSPTLWPRFQETHDMLREWLPRTEEFILRGATHALQMQNPGDLSVALSSFVARHPLSRS